MLISNGLTEIGDCIGGVRAASGDIGGNRSETGCGTGTGGV